MATPVHLRDVVDIILRLCEDAATPIAYKVSCLVRNGEWGQIARMRVDPRSYTCAETYLRDASCVDFLRKADFLPGTSAVERRKAALDNFWKAERQCYVSNERLSPYLYGSNLDGDAAVRLLIEAARKKIALCLGSRPPDVFGGRFGPGATFADKVPLATVPDKMSSRPTLTTGAIGFLLPWAGTAWARACVGPAGEGWPPVDRSPQFVRGNRFTTVPKDSLKDRGIAVEPSINVFYQLGIARYLRSSLKRVGIDLRFGQELHRKMARQGSITGEFATIDLSNASDTVCYNLVKLLLPTRWFNLLDSLRSPFTCVEGKWVKLEKFSSMGNGFTFELETLLFWSLAASAVELSGGKVGTGVNLSVFGDDIIVPSGYSKVVTAVLRFFGFEPNASKTFHAGPFRESCGGDYFEGRSVRPHYLEKLPNEPQELIRLANGLRRLDEQYAGLNCHTRPAFRAWRRVLDLIPSPIRRCRGPEELGDLVIHDRPDQWVIKVRHSVRYVRVYRPVAKSFIGWHHFRPDVVLASALLGVGDGSRGVLPRDSVTGYKLGWVPYS